MKFYKVKPGNSTEGVGYSNEGGEGSKQGWFSLKKTFANEFASKPLLSKPILSIISMGGGWEQLQHIVKLHSILQTQLNFSWLEKQLT